MVNNTMKEDYKNLDSCRKTSWFAMILYPECEEHMKVLEYIKMSIDVYEYGYILHDKDLDENGELKKPHIHLMYKFPKQATAKAQFESFCGLINHIEPIYDQSSYYQYMLHKRLADIVSGKHLYDESEMICSDNFSRKCIGKTSKSSLNKILILYNYVRECNGDLYSVINYAIENDLYDLYEKIQYSIIALSKDIKFYSTKTYESKVSKELRK